MRIRTAFAIVMLACALSIAPGAAERRGGVQDDKAAIEALVEQVAAANNAGDVEAWMALFADDFVYMAPGAPSVTTRDGLREVAKAGFRHQASVRIEPLEIRVFSGWAFARNRVAGDVTLHGSGEVVPVDVKQIVVYSKNDQGVWRIARLISNSNAP